MATGIVAGLAGEGGDPRLSIAGIDNNASAPGPTPAYKRLLHDPSVSFLEYKYYAEQTRAEEKASALSDPATTGIWQLIFPTKSGAGVTPVAAGHHDTSSSENEKSEKVGDVGQQRRATITEAEWTNASRAVRTASGAACFYLITTDILGPFNVPFAIGSLGWGPGVALFTVFGAMAGYSGWLLWTVFLGLDSYEYPVKNYSNLAFRLYGSIPRAVVNILQALQLTLSVGNIVISNGVALSQVSKFKVCYTVCCLVWALCGFFLGQIRTLQKFGMLANVAVFLNLMVIFVTMGVIAHSPPNYPISVLGSVGGVSIPSSIVPDANGVYPAIIHYSGLPDPSSIIGSLNGLMQGVYAYAGAQLFIEFMAEMRRPFDFLKAMWGAQFFIYSVYLIYGCYVYHYQGQYTYNQAYQGVSPYGWQVVGDMLAVLSGVIAATLYGNIGIKVIYNNVLMEYFHAPSLLTKQGKWLWAIIVPIYWSNAFILAGAIPDFVGVTGLTAALCFVQFTYTFPSMLAVGFWVQKNAVLTGEGFDPRTGQVVQHDRGVKRWIRGFMAKEWYLTVFHVLYAGGALSVAGLGAYAAIMQLIEAFELPQLNAFNCRSPIDLSPQ